MTFQCPNCGHEFDNKVSVAQGTFGLGGFSFGLRAALPQLWPFTTRVYARCPNCGRRGWIKVVPPQHKVLIGLPR